MDTYAYKCALMDLDSNEWLIMLPDGYYMCSSYLSSELGYGIWPKYYSFDQLDIRYNRPDIVWERIGSADSSMINAYKRAYCKRLKYLNIDTAQLKSGYDVPETDFTDHDSIAYNQTKDKLVLKIHATDSMYQLNRLNV